MGGKRRCRDEDTLRRLLALERAGERLKLWATDGVVRGPLLGLDVDLLEAESVETDDTVDARVVDAAAVGDGTAFGGLEPIGMVVEDTEQGLDELVESRNGHRDSPFYSATAGVCLRQVPAG